MKLAVTVLSACLAMPVMAAENLGKAVAAYESHDWAAAEKALRSLVASEPENAAAYAYLALVHLEQDKAGPAGEEVSKAGELAADSVETKVARARLAVENGEPDRAMAILSETLEAEPGNTLALYHRGQVYFRSDQFEAAAADFEKVIEEKPDHAYAYYYAGLAYSKLDKPDKMVDRYQQFLKRKPDAPESKRIRALLRGVR